MMEKPIPKPTKISAPFWQAALEERYIIQQCKECSGYNSYPRQWCSHCWSEELEWVSASGKGEILTYSVIHQSPSPAWEAPYILAVIKLEEGIQIMSNIVRCDIGEVKIGMSVQVEFESRGEVKVPIYAPQQ